ncbi:DUF4034 domain-containing protein [Roseiarcaceae bacterium H3SJ34-1]|uniref:DUF4034 domain-containing protein n=1 Tax=Terripilifer ovatus TaxID=3032367 RepID=UPI003AB9870D|nr:DUF4034 domain-containing protein [Roseiarcaceae bacterium H3SJ34-1]
MKTPTALLFLSIFSVSTAWSQSAKQGPLPDVPDISVPGTRIAETEFAFKFNFQNRYNGFGIRNSPNLPEAPAEFDDKGRPKFLDGAEGLAFLQSLAGQLLHSKQYDDLDRLFEDARDPNALTASGTWKLRAIYRGTLPDFDAKTDPSALLAERLKWKEHSPRSAEAALSEVDYWYGYAWYARGSGYANTVTEDGWRLMRERLLTAHDRLIKSAAVASASPEFYRLHIDLGGAMGAPKDRILDAFREAVKKFPTYYVLYSVTARSLMPKWGGSWEMLDDFAKEAIELSRKTEGASFYARIYMTIAGEQREYTDIFRDTRASWPLVKQGFEDMQARYPYSAANRNSEASFACRADDKSAYIAARLRMGNKIESNVWIGAYSLDLCDHKFPPAPI